MSKAASILPKFRSFTSINPYTQQKIINQVPFVTKDQLQGLINRGHDAFLNYREATFDQKKQKFIELAKNIKHNADRYALAITEEMGKPITQAKGEVLKSAVHCEYYAENMRTYLRPEDLKVGDSNAHIHYEPLGLLYVIVPFNFPFWLTFKSCIPNLALGNTVLIRNSDSTPRLGKLLEDLFVSSGFDKGEFQNIYSSPEQTDDIIESKLIQGVSFTGSSVAGAYIAGSAGKNLKKCAMELGGSDPFIVLENASVEKAVEIAIKSRLANAGQVCFSAKRFLIHEKHFAAFKDLLVKKLKNVEIGNPSDEKTQLGPLARSDLVTNLESQIQKAQQQGAILLYGGKRLQGNFFQPTVLELNSKDNILFEEEVFGPVFALLSVKSTAEAIEIANNSDYGLGGVVIGEDLKEAEQVARKIHVGMARVNDAIISDSRIPSGGVKRSGYGRECGEFGIKEFANIRYLLIP